MNVDALPETASEHLGKRDIETEPDLALFLEFLLQAAHKGALWDASEILGLDQDLVPTGREARTKDLLARSAKLTAGV